MLEIADRNTQLQLETCLLLQLLGMLTLNLPAPARRVWLPT